MHCRCWDLETGAPILGSMQPSEQLKASEPRPSGDFSASGREGGALVQLALGAIEERVCDVFILPPFSLGHMHVSKAAMRLVGFSGSHRFLLYDLSGLTVQA